MNVIAQKVSLSPAEQFNEDLAQAYLEAFKSLNQIGCPYYEEDEPADFITDGLKQVCQRVFDLGPRKIELSWDHPENLDALSDELAEVRITAFSPALYAAKSQLDELESYCEANNLHCFDRSLTDELTEIVRVFEAAHAQAKERCKAAS